MYTVYMVPPPPKPTPELLRYYIQGKFYHLPVSRFASISDVVTN